MPNNYLDLKFTYTNQGSTDLDNEIVDDILAALLAPLNFETFQRTEDGFHAYIPVKEFNRIAVKQILTELPFENLKVDFSMQEVETEDWNQKWVQNYFQPLYIEDYCAIRASFHPEPKGVKHDIIIDPKMAFGTGNHETTRLMIRSILNTEMTHKRVIDMGCGTGILSIISSLEGAAEIDAIDIDPWACDNAKDNLKINNINNCHVYEGDAQTLETLKPADIILANINRNIILNDLEHYAKILNPNGMIIMSGFYKEDIKAIENQCNVFGLKKKSENNENNWATISVYKI